MLALFNIGGGEIVLLLALLLIFGVAALVIVGLIIFLIARGRAKSSAAVPPSAPATPSPTPADRTQVMPRKCPKCGAELKADAPEGLCPACLLQRGLATEGGGAFPGTQSFTPPPLAELAKLFPQLEILEIIGQGGMGAVYKARQPALDRFVALKILAPRSGGDLDFSGRFSREARALARLSHPNIVGVYDFGQIQPAANLPPGDPSSTSNTQPLSYFIMEYVDGPNLRQVELAGKLTPREALQIIPQICAALQFAHDEGIVHRDIKPENVLLDKKGRVKIADFGLAKILGQEADFRLTGARDVMGTPHYMAPEQVETPQEVDHRADIYSLGVVFYEMLTGELPLGKFDPPSHKVQVDVRLDDVVMRSLSKNPERRYQHVSEVGTRVETIAQNPSSPGARPDVEAFAEEMAARDYQLEIRSCVRRGWNLVKKNFGPVFGINALVMAGLAFMWWIALLASAKQPRVAVAPMLAWILTGPIMAGWYLYFLKLIRGERPTLKSIFSAFKNRFLQLLLGSLVMALLEGVGFACFVLPGIYLHIAWLFTLVLIIDKSMDFWPAMELTRKVITRHWWKFFGFAMVLFLLTLVGFMFCGVGYLITGPIVFAAFMYAYEDVFGLNPSAPAKATAPVQPQTSRGSGGAGLGIALNVTIILVAIIGLVAVMGITKKVKHRREHARSEESLHHAQEEKAWAMEAQRTDSGIDTVNGRSDSAVIEGFALPTSRLIFSLGAQEVWSSSFSRKTVFTATLERADRGLHLNVVDSHDHTLLDVTERDSLGRADFNRGNISFVEGMVHPGPDGRLDDAGWCTLGYFQPENAGALPICVKLVDEKIWSASEDHATADSTNAAAAVETWSPALAPGERPDLQKILSQAKELADTAHYDEALQHHLWYHNHALEYDPGQAGVRLSFALSDWIELGRQYPKARRALVEIRDRDTRQFSEGHGNFKLFMDVNAINGYLEDDTATYTLFKKIESLDKSLARQCFFVAEPLLLQKGEYDTCLDYIGDPQSAFERIRDSYAGMKKWEDDQTLRRADEKKRFEEMGKTNPAFARLPFLSEPPKRADNIFIGQMKQLIEVLVGADRKPEAEKIRDQALAVLDDDRIQSAVSDAEQEVQKRAATSTPTAEDAAVGEKVEK
ncbi:MAG TPA: protein kinase [Verrucomicrobiae bacterium]|jgi:hypothetical protein|nr:protein kinase [Verrucomicrobiae bacterium]